jgi:hypothetical protein
LILAKNTELTQVQVRNRLTGFADPWGAATQFGAGKVNAHKALVALSVSITGPTTIKTAGPYSWTANPSGGNGSYTYQWQASDDGGAWYTVGSSKTYSRQISLESPRTLDLRVIVTSSGVQATATHRVNNLILR